MKYIKTYERLGYVKDIDDFSDKLLKIIKRVKNKLDTGFREYNKNGTYIFRIKKDLIPEKILNSCFYIYIYKKLKVIFI